MKFIKFFIYLYFLLQITGCEGENYCLFCDIPLGEFKQDYIIECLDDKYPVAIRNNIYGNSTLSGSVENYTFEEDEYELYDTDPSRWYTDNVLYYGIFCLEMGENTFELYSGHIGKNYLFSFYKLDLDNDGKYLYGNDDDVLLEEYKCNWSCEDTIVGSFLLE